METKILESIEGVSIYPIISLIVFVLFFTGVIIWMIKSDKEHLKKMAELPLADDTIQSENGLHNNQFLKG